MLHQNAPKTDRALPEARGSRLGRLPIRPRRGEGAQARSRGQLQRRPELGGGAVRATLHGHRVPEHEVGESSLCLCFNQDRRSLSRDFRA